MPIPEFEDVRFPKYNNQTLKYSNVFYGIDYIRSGEMDVNFTINGLQSNHDYEIAVYIMNLNQVHNVQYSKVYFKTMKMQRIALVTLKLF